MHSFDTIQKVMYPIRKIKTPENLTALAYQSIKEYILREDLDENTRLTEEFLSAQLGISKSPVREALNSLSTEGLIRIEPRRGAFLRTFSRHEVQDLYNLREQLEAYAVSIAEVDPRMLQEMRRSIGRTKKFLKAKDRTRHIEEDMKFHGLIAAAAKNDELCRVLTNVQNRILLCRRLTYDLSASTAPEAHKAILDALAKGNRKAAELAMRKHISLVRNRLLGAMTQQKD